MTTSVRFCLSYDCFKLDFIVFKVDIISVENVMLSRTLLWLYMYAPKCYVMCGHTIFMTWRYPLNRGVIIKIDLQYLIDNTLGALINESLTSLTFLIICVWNFNCEMSRLTKPTKWHVGPAKTPISLGIHPVWLESSPCTLWVGKDQTFLHVDSKDFDLSRHWRTCQFVRFVMWWLRWLFSSLLT